ncbi:MAG: hypothetical protein V1891_01830 [bacterium]
MTKGAFGDSPIKNFMPEEQLKKRDAESEIKPVIEQKPELLKMSEKFDRVGVSLEKLREREAANAEIGEIKIGAVGESAEECNVIEAENAKEDERLKQEVKDFFRKIILNSKEPERQEIEAELRKIAIENEVKFDEIIDESYKLRDDIVKIIRSKKFNVGILGKIEKWLGLIFPKSNEFCKQVAFRLTNEIKEHWKLQ